MRLVFQVGIYIHCTMNVNALKICRYASERCLQWRMLVSKLMHSIVMMESIDIEYLYIDMINGGTKCVY